MSDKRLDIKRALALLAIGATVIVVSGCGSSTSSTTSGTSAATGSTDVLPVARNPISNSATAAGLTITKALVENNLSPTNGKTVDDHLEFVLKNTSARPLDQVEVYYKITDPSKGSAEGYHSVLNGVSIKPGATQVVHFDNTGVAGHFPVNKYSLYYLDKNALKIDIVASANGVKPATFTIKKDAGGAEAGVESGAPTG